MRELLREEQVYNGVLRTLRVLFLFGQVVVTLYIPKPKKIFLEDLEILRRNANPKNRHLNLCMLIKPPEY